MINEDEVDLKEKPEENITSIKNPKHWIPNFAIIMNCGLGKVHVRHAWRHLAGGGWNPGQVAPATRSLILVPPRLKEAVFKVVEPKLVDRLLLP